MKTQNHKSSSSVNDVNDIDRSSGRMTSYSNEGSVIRTESSNNDVIRPLQFDNSKYSKR